MEDGRVKMIATYFTPSSNKTIEDTRVVRYKSKSTKLVYSFKVSESSIYEYQKDGLINKEIDKLMKSLVCIIRDERSIRFLRRT